MFIQIYADMLSLNSGVSGTFTVVILKYYVIELTSYQMNTKKENVKVEESTKEKVKVSNENVVFISSNDLVNWSQHKHSTSC